MDDVEIIQLDQSPRANSSNNTPAVQDEPPTEEKNDSEGRKSTGSKGSRTSPIDDVLSNTFNSEKFPKTKNNNTSYNRNRFTTNNDETKKSYNKRTISLGCPISEDFVSKLDAKLKDLEEDGKKKKRTLKSRSLDNRPMFITTVKTGIFLDPPPELAALLGYPRSYNLSSGSSYNSQKSGEELMYSFSSQPRVLNHKYNPIKNKTPKVNNDKQQVANNEKLQNRNNLRVKRDLNSLNSKKDEQPAAPTYGNIMTDRRVCRGPAFLHHPVPTVGLDSQANRQAEARRRAMARRKAQHHRSRQIFDHPLEMSVTTQTEVHIDRPPTPPFVPQKIGLDEATQVYPGELFQFEVEVKPVLEVLVGKTIEQALIEVMEEDELAAIKEQKRRFNELKDAELAEDARLEELERRKKEEMELRILEQESVLKDQQDTQDRIAAAVLTTGYIADLLPSVFSGLREAGFMVDEIEEKIEDNFMTWLVNEVKTEMQRLVENKDFLSGYSGVHCPRSICSLEEMLRDIVQTRAEMYRALGQKDNERLGVSDEEPEKELPFGEDFGEGEDKRQISYVMKFGDDDSEVLDY
uniref:Radial spoke head protein 3 homolog n=1 Tax=Rhodnius prolixus TaxID=13249 RepID=T1HAT2_RHOPR